MPQRLWPLPQGLWLQPLHSRAVTIMLLVCCWSADSMNMHSTRMHVVNKRSRAVCLLYQSWSTRRARNQKPLVRRVAQGPQAAEGLACN